MKSKRINGHGYEEWKLPNGDYHREDSPAVEFVNGSKAWWINGKRHREDGPAIDYVNMHEEWYLDNIQYTEQEYKYKTRSRKLKQLL
jgi:hypothetical protein